MSASSTIQPASDPPAPLVPREWRLRLDPLLLLATLGIVACSLIAIKGSTADDVARPALLLPRAPGDLRGGRARAHVRRLAARLLAAARAQVRHLRAADRLDPARVRPRHRHARLQALDRAAVLPLPALGAGQAAAGHRPLGLHRRPDAADGPRGHRADHAAGAAAGDAGHGPARPRDLARLRRRRARAAVRGGRAVAPLRRAGGARRRSRSRSSSSPRRRSASRCSSPTRCSA